MPASKVQDLAESRRWIEAGVTSAEMGQHYRDTYGIPWRMQEQHRWERPVVMLRLKARRCAGRTLRDENRRRLAHWRSTLQAPDTVVDHDPTPGFALVARRPGVDDNLMCEPHPKTTAWCAVD